MSLQLNETDLLTERTPISQRLVLGPDEIWITRDKGPCDVLALHGTGQSANRHGVGYLRSALAASGFSMASLDFPGHGDSPGRESEDTLTDRFRQARAVTEMLRPRALLGVSMGAFVAGSIAREAGIDCLIFFCPALYPPALLTTPFGPDFRAQLRMPGWYKASPLLNEIGSFSGDLLIVAGRQDPVTPPDSVQLLHEFARNARSRHLIWLDDCDHAVHAHLRSCPTERDSVTVAISNTLRPSIHSQNSTEAQT